MSVEMRHRLHAASPRERGDLAIEAPTCLQPLPNPPRRTKGLSVPSDVTRPTAFNPGPSLARVAATSGGWTIDCRSPRAAQTHSFACEGCAAEFARTLRDEGGWSLRFGPGCKGIAGLVAELDEAFAA